MDLFSLNEEQIISLLVRRAGIREDLMRLFRDTEDSFFMGYSREDAEIYLQDDALCYIADKLGKRVEYEYSERINSTYAFFFMELYGKEYKIFCLLEGDAR